MPPRSKILAFPDSVRAELHQRIRENNFSGYIELAEWIASVGYPVGKSQICEYAKTHRAEILATGSLIGRAAIPAAASLASQRIACLNAALKMRPPDEALSYAELLIDWAYRP